MDLTEKTNLADESRQKVTELQQRIEALAREAVAPLILREALGAVKPALLGPSPYRATSRLSRSNPELQQPDEGMWSDPDRRLHPALQEVGHERPGQIGVVGLEAVVVGMAEAVVGVREEVPLDGLAAGDEALPESGPWIAGVAM